MSLFDDGAGDRRARDGATSTSTRPARRPGGRRRTWAEFDRATQEHGLAPTGGRVSTTGVAGLTLGGGSGWLERRFGLTCDNLVCVELVTADGERVTRQRGRAPRTLLGAARRRRELRRRHLARVPPASRRPGGLRRAAPLPGRGAAVDALRSARPFATAPGALGPRSRTSRRPPDVLPAEWRAGSAAAVVCWPGPVGRASACARRCGRAGRCHLFGELPYAELQSLIDDPPGQRNWWTAEYLGDLPDEASTRSTPLAAMPTGLSQSLVVPWGGASRRGGRRDPDGARRRAGSCTRSASGTNRTRRRAHGLGRRARTSRRARPGRLPELHRRRGRGPRPRGVRRRDATSGSPRQGQYDPDNVFRGNQNVRPVRAPAVRLS